MDKNILKERYEPPEIEVGQVAVEVGFAGSGESDGITTTDMPIKPL